LPGWDTFAVIIGGAAGALVGLLFVSISIRIDVISASPDFRNRGAETLSLFMTVLLVALLLGIPGQHDWELGAELVVLAVVLGVGLFWLDRRATAHRSAHPISRVLDVLSPAHDHDALACGDRRATARGRRRRDLRRGSVRARGYDRRRGECVALPDEDHLVTGQKGGQT
jgi:hypothetical protein